MSLEINHVTKRFGHHIAVNNLSLTLEKGEVLGLLGRNGAGKTTTIKMMLGLLTSDSGSILWNEQPLNRKHITIGYLPEERGLYPKTKISEQLRYFGTLEGMKKKEVNQKIDEWLERFEITEYKEKMAGELSKGNQQKIQIIATLLHNPELIILDEPFSGLDPVNAEMLSHVLEEEIAQGKTVILSSHRMEQIESFCENVCMLKNGEVMVSGKLRDVKEQYGYKTLSIESSVPLDETITRLHLSFEKKHNVYKTHVRNEREAIDILHNISLQGHTLRNFSLLEPTLHEIFVERVK